MGSFTMAGKASVLSCLLAGTLAAQSMGPPAYLQIFRERIKVGHVAAHRQVEAGWPRAFAGAKIANNYMALSSMYGPNQMWFVEPHNSLAEIDAANKAIDAAPGLTGELDRLSAADAAHVDNVDALLARYVPEASNPGSPELADMRVWEITIFRVRPGKDASFFEGAALYKSLVDQAKADAPWATFQVMAGMPGPTYLVFSPRKTLGDLDPATGAGAAIQKAMTEETMKRFGSISEGFLSVETQMFTVSPAMSYPPAEWVSHDPAFWGRKPMATPKPAPKP